MEGNKEKQWKAIMRSNGRQKGEAMEANYDNWIHKIGTGVGRRM
jgi:hypothetical protein